MMHVWFYINVPLINHILVIAYLADPQSITPYVAYLDLGLGVPRPYIFQLAARFSTGYCRTVYSQAVQERFG